MQWSDYDPEDPVTALGRGHINETCTKALDKDGLKGARIGILRESMSVEREARSRRISAKWDAVFEKNVAEPKAAGAIVVDSSRSRT